MAVVQLFKTASEVKEVGGGNTSTPRVSQAHFIALKIDGDVSQLARKFKKVQTKKSREIK